MTPTSFPTRVPLFTLLTAATALALSLPLSAQNAEVRFYPENEIFPHELDVRRGVQSVLLQNGAIVYRGAGAIELEAASLEVLSSGRVIASSEFGLADLEKAAKKGAGLQASGMLQMFAFQFRPDALFGKEPRLAATPRLETGEALLLGHKFIAWTGIGDSLRLRFRGKTQDGKAFETSGQIAIAQQPSSVTYHFPLAGRSFIAAGATPHSHHRWVAAEEFALDIARFGDGTRTFRGDGTRLTDYYAYGAEVLAAADGTVVSVIDQREEGTEFLRRPGEAFAAYNERVGQMQAQLMEKGLDHIAGNVVVIDHGNGEFSHYAHLAKGSTKVKKGDKVVRGQVIGLLGNSGNSTEPHLHFQITNGPDSLLSAGRPCRFANIELPWADWERQVQTGDVVDAK